MKFLPNTNPLVNSLLRNMEKIRVLRARIYGLEKEKLKIQEQIIKLKQEIGKLIND